MKLSSVMSDVISVIAEADLMSGSSGDVVSLPASTDVRADPRGICG
jgi:hypothetical protein